MNPGYALAHSERSRSGGTGERLAPDTPPVVIDGIEELARDQRCPCISVGRRGVRGEADHGQVKLKLDLREVYNRGGGLTAPCVLSSMRRSRRRRPGADHPWQESGALKKRVPSFLNQKELKALYHRVEKEPNNLGRIFVRFRWK